MLLDFAIVPAYVRCWVSWSSKSLKVLPGAGQPVGHRDRGPRRDDALLEQRGGGEHLAGAAGLVGLGQCAVAAVLRARLARRVGVERRHGRHREQLAAARVEHDDGAALRVRRRDGLGDRLLRDELDVPVDGEPHVVAGDRLALGVDAARQPSPAGAELVGRRPVAAGQHVVEGVLQPAEALPVGPDEADDVRGRAAAGVDPLARLLAEDAGDALDRRVGKVEVADLPPGLRRHLLRDVREACLAGEPLLQDRRLDPEHGREQRRGRGRVGLLRDLGLVGGDVHRVDRRREGDAVAVGDGPADGGQGDRAQAGLLGLRGVRRRVEALQLHQPRAEQREHDGEHHQGGAQPAWAVAEAQHRGRAGRRAATRRLPAVRLPAVRRGAGRRATGRRSAGDVLAREHAPTGGGPVGLPYPAGADGPEWSRRRSPVGAGLACGHLGTGSVG